MKKNTKMSAGKKMAIGGGVVALTAATAGAYYLLGPNKKEHQKKVAQLLAKMKKEVNAKIKEGKLVAVPLYHKAVDVVAKNYAKQYKMHEKEINVLAKKLKGEWRNVSKTATKTVKKSIKSMKKRA